ncbi:hypothetical protein [Bacillus xiapuensis]|uniref:hypothetical protein n=1 Tax=Bacillus xiapuensis TaxID=2014075 RepID=UPI0012FE01E6|nr:hypothetical protein [Bacillus xiapuensis]
MRRCLRQLADSEDEMGDAARLRLLGITGALSIVRFVLQSSSKRKPSKGIPVHHASKITA